MNVNKYISERIKYWRNRKNMTQEELAELLNIKQQSIARYENNQRKFKQDVLFKLSEAFNISIDELFPPKGNTNFKNKIPILGKIPAGIPIEAIEDIIDYEEVSDEMLKGDREYFGLKIKGNSMNPKYFNDDIVLFLKVSDCESGEDCAVIVNGNDAIFKRVIKQDKGIILQSLNPEYESNFYSCEDIEKLPICIIGVAKEIRRKI